jgi:hypothetical protein
MPSKWHRARAVSIRAKCTIEKVASMSNINSAAPPPGWEREVPRYQVLRPVRQSPNDNHKHLPPPSYCSDDCIWMYADREYAAGEVVETKFWPHGSFVGLNHVARQILSFLNSAPKSRLGRSPYNSRGELSLETGLTGPTQPKFKIGATAA